MAKKSSVARNEKRRKMSAAYADKRAAIKAKIYDKKTSISERVALQMSLAAMPRNSSKTRIRNRCVITGRPRGYYRDFHVSRIVFREMASEGHLPGVLKASW